MKRWGTVVLSFVGSCVLFGAIFSVPFWKRSPSNTVAAPREEGVRRSAWVVFHDKDTLTGLVRVATDTSAMTVEIVGYPVNTEVIDGVEITNAQVLYAKRGADIVRKIADDELLVLSVSGAVSLMGRVSGNLTITLPQAVGTLPMGAMTLTPLQAAQVMRYTDWEQGEVAAAQMYATLTAAFLRRVLCGQYTALDGFGFLTEVCDSRLHIMQFAAVEQDWEALRQTGEAVRITDRVAGGATVGVGERRRYVLTE